ncbi:hypothetical protein TARUN_9863 [Trichoderma arundinaceum]|uniref:AA1-like domain-containing protein n=1 Tax=Trichoderma arundinaceum TaxID=490622 RepID=A0A395N8E9_TRIAR|nr:hypothetical protein TARUN_9863 [Trichoderma arundinaceum]
MRFEALSLLAGVPSAMATMSALSYTPPPELLAQAQSDSACNLPPDFHIKNFAAKSNGTGPAASLVAYNFTFVDETTSITTSCSFNSSSVSTTPSGLTPRTFTYEVAGSATIFLSCSASGACKTNSTDYDTKFTALDPVTDPTLAKYWVS